MRTGAAEGHQGYFHETAFYSSDDEFLQIVAPFLADGVAAGEPVVAAFSGANDALLRDVFGTGSGILFLPGGTQYARPARAIREYRGLLADFVAGGAQQIRIAGDVPHPGVGVAWDWWARYEAVVNHAFDDFPLWGLCPYDTRTAPVDVLAHARRTHPRIATVDGHVDNPAYTDQRTLLSGRAATWTDPAELQPPRAELVDPSAAEVRRAITALGQGEPVPTADLEDLRLAATEAVTNAALHGVPPIRVRLWTAEHRMIVTVSDAGAGPDDPFAGLVPVQGTQIGGRGLWLIHQLCSYVTLERSAAGFTVRMVAGTPAPAFPEPAR